MNSIVTIKHLFPIAGAKAMIKTPVKASRRNVGFTTVTIANRRASGTVWFLGRVVTPDLSSWTEDFAGVTVAWQWSQCLERSGCRKFEILYGVHLCCLYGAEALSSESGITSTAVIKTTQNCKSKTWMLQTL